MWKYTQLSWTLAGLYYLQEDSIRIMLASGIPPGIPHISNSAINSWTSILQYAESNNKIRDVLNAVLNEYPGNQFLINFLADENSEFKNVYSGSSFSWKANTSPARLEKLIGEKSTLLPISFLEIGLEMAKCVARIVTTESLGTGFLVDDNYLITNNHVIPNEVIARKSKIQFNYQKNKEGALLKFEEFELEPDSGFATSPYKENDWTVVKVKDDLNKKFGLLSLCKEDISENDFVNIIQHPGGEHKQIGLYHNLVTYSDNNIVQYLTDTLPGSSGSPVFNSDWEVVALHHSGGWIKEPNLKQEVIRNEGINIRLVKQEANSKGIKI